MVPHLDPDTSRTHVMKGAVLIFKMGQTISISSLLKKFNKAQLKYMIMGQEVLAIKESCQHHFRNIIHGCNEHLITRMLSKVN